MKKFIFFLLLLCFYNAQSQPNQINIVNFTVKNTLPSSVDVWMNSPGALLLTVQRGQQARDLKPFMVLQIKSGGSIICGNNASTAKQIDPFDVRTFTTAELLSFLPGCKELKEGSYSLCVQFFSAERKELSREVCKEFTVAAAKKEYSPPQNIAPANQKQLTEKEMSAPVTFRWTPIVPKPQEPVTYRLKVWQLMQGQNSTQAMRTNPPIVTKDVDNLTQTIVTGIYTGPCRPPYLCDYIWEVQALNREGNPMGSNEGRSEPFSFKVEGSQTTSPPKNVFPADKKQFTEKEMSTPVTFRWTPLVPKPQESVTYRLKVWQLMQGQNSTEAMRTNKPIVTKDVADITEATVSGIYTGPCRPPYLCDYVWSVQALNKAGNPIGNNNGTSEPTAFAVSLYIIQLDSIKVSCTNTPGVYSFSYTITNPNPGPATLNLFTVTSSVPAGASIGTFSPPINTVINSGNQLTITGTINAAPNLSNICIGAEIKDVGNAFWKASKDTCVKVDVCRCDACDEKNFVFTAPKPSPINYTNNTLAYNQNITVTTTPAKTIKSITAELVYFELVPENNLCIPCNKDAATYGHFTNGTNSLQWSGPQTVLNINITTPQLVPCCSALFRWCIRYKIEFTDCTSCNKLVCYEKKKEGCDKIPVDNNNKDPK